MFPGEEAAATPGYVTLEIAVAAHIVSCCFAMCISKEERMIFMWMDLSFPWQECFKEAWASYCQGSLPIGAVVVIHRGML